MTAEHVLETAVDDIPTVDAVVIPVDDERAAWDHGADGAAFVLDQPIGIPALWGRGTQVLWAKGEALMIAGQQGVGKTTVAGQIVAGLLGIGDGDVLGLPVTDMGCKILYLAMDRPRQIARSLRRQFGPRHRDILSQRLVVWEGPPPRDLAANPALLAKMCDFYDAGVVIVDSLKDAAVGLSTDEVGARWNRARQNALAQGVQILELHHTTKRGPAGAPITGVADIYGSMHLTSGAGSVILLTGEPGDPIVNFRHVKQPAEEYGPYSLNHDQAQGFMSIDNTTDLVEMVKAAGVDGLNAHDAAMTLFDKEKPTKAEVEKARRKLDRKVKDGVLVRVDGQRGGARHGDRSTTAWFLAAVNHAQSRSITDPQESVIENGKTAGQTITHSDAPRSITETPPINHGNRKTAGQTITRSITINHADPAPINHVFPPPLGGGEKRDCDGGARAGQAVIYDWPIREGHRDFSSPTHSREDM